MRPPINSSAATRRQEEAQKCVVSHSYPVGRSFGGGGGVGAGISTLHLELRLTSGLPGTFAPSGRVLASDPSHWVAVRFHGVSPWVGIASRPGFLYGISRPVSRIATFIVRQGMRTTFSIRIRWRWLRPTLHNVANRVANNVSNFNDDRSRGDRSANVITPSTTAAASAAYQHRRSSHSDRSCREDRSPHRYNI